MKELVDKFEDVARIERLNAKPSAKWYEDLVRFRRMSTDTTATIFCPCGAAYTWSHDGGDALRAWVVAHVAHTAATTDGAEVLRVFEEFQRLCTPPPDTLPTSGAVIQAEDRLYHHLAQTVLGETKRGGPWTDCIRGIREAQHSASIRGWIDGLTAVQLREMFIFSEMGADRDDIQTVMRKHAP